MINNQHIVNHLHNYAMGKIVNHPINPYVTSRVKRPVFNLEPLHGGPVYSHTPPIKIPFVQKLFSK